MNERRYFATEFEVRTKPTGGALVTGHGAVFERLSKNLGGFVERVDAGAFKKTLADGPDTRAFFNHDPSMILGRTRAGTLRLSVDSVGLAYEIDMPETSYARDLLVSMERGDVTQSSFAFRVVTGGDEWSETDEGFPLRTLRAVSIHDGDVSPVTVPAYDAADSGLAERAYRSLAAHLGVDVSIVARAAADNTLARAMRGDVEEPPPAKADAEEWRAENAAIIRRALELQHRI